MLIRLNWTRDELDEGDGRIGRGQGAPKKEIFFSSFAKFEFKTGPETEINMQEQTQRQSKSKIQNLKNEKEEIGTW